MAKQQLTCIMTRENDWKLFWERAEKFGYTLGDVNLNGLMRCLLAEMVEQVADEDFVSYLKDFSRLDKDAPVAVQVPKEKPAKKAKEAKPAKPAAAPKQAAKPAPAAKPAKTPKGKGGGAAPAPAAPAITLNVPVVKPVPITPVITLPSPAPEKDQGRKVSPAAKGKKPAVKVKSKAAKA